MAEDTSEPATLIKVKGRSYRELPDGKLVPVFDPVEHAQAQFKAIGKAHTVQGVRIVDGSDPEAPAVNVTFDEAEGAQVLDVIRTILESRAMPVAGEA